MKADERIRMFIIVYTYILQQDSFQFFCETINSLDPPSRATDENTQLEISGGQDTKLYLNSVW